MRVLLDQIGDAVHDLRARVTVELRPLREGDVRRVDGFVDISRRCRCYRCDDFLGRGARGRHVLAAFGVAPATVDE